MILIWWKKLKQVFDLCIYCPNNTAYRGPNNSADGGPNNTADRGPNSSAHRADNNSANRADNSSADMRFIDSTYNGGIGNNTYSPKGKHTCTLVKWGTRKTSKATLNTNVNTGSDKLCDYWLWHEHRGTKGITAMFFAPVGIQTCKKLISNVTGRLVKNAFTPQTCMPTFKKFAVRVEIELFLKTSI